MSISVPSLSVSCSDDLRTLGLLEDREVLLSRLSLREFSLETLALPSARFESGRVRLGPLVPFPRVESVSGSVRVRPFGFRDVSALDVQSGESWTGLCAH